MNIKREFHGDKEDYAYAKKFAEKVKFEAPELVHSIVLFGSAARSTWKEKIYAKDIDILIIVNDNIQILNKEVIAAFRVIVQSTASAISKRFHINNLRLTEFMDFVRNGDPIAINMLRDGIPLLDDGFFFPLKMLLERGQIKPSEENVWVYHMRAPITVQSAKWHMLQATIDLYWAVIDAAHAGLLSMGLVPYHPQHLSELLREKIIKKGHLHKRHAAIVDKYYRLQSDILKRKLRQVSGKEFDAYEREVKGFIEDMKTFVMHNHPHMTQK